MQISPLDPLDLQKKGGYEPSSYTDHYLKRANTGKIVPHLGQYLPGPVRGERGPWLRWRRTVPLLRSLPCACGALIPTLVPGLGLGGLIGRRASEGAREGWPPQVGAAPQARMEGGLWFSSRSRSIREGYRSDPACKMGFLDGSPGSFERAVRVGAVRWLGA